MRNYENCQNCGKPTISKKFCTDQCKQLYNREPKGPKPLLVKQNKKNQILDAELEIQLTNTQYQKGLSWRQEKLEAVAEARNRKIEEKTIFRILKRAGLTDQTARKIMRDARFLNE